MKRIPVGDTFALVDDADYEMLSKYRWVLNKGYAFTTSGVNGERRMHRIIMGAQRGQEVDHIDRNPLNNSRTNLRLCTHQENALNRSLFKNNKSGAVGVSWHKISSKWMAHIKRNGKDKHVGIFETVEEAVRARTQALQELSNAN